jgi:hypothetical protein
MVGFGSKAKTAVSLANVAVVANDKVDMGIMIDMDTQLNMCFEPQGGLTMSTFHVF